MSTSYGQHNSHRDWLKITKGTTNKHDKQVGKNYHKNYIKDINDDEAILTEPPQISTDYDTNM